MCVPKCSTLRTLGNTCDNCKQRFPQTKTISCGLCDAAAYCSQECLEKDKESHQLKCQFFGAITSSKEMNYVNAWFHNGTSDILVELATHAMTKKEFLNKNPQFHIEFEVQFSEKYCTFVPIKKPRILYFSDLHHLELQFVKNVFTSFKDLIGPFELGHVLTIRFRLKSGVLVPRRRYTKYTANQYQQLSYEEAMASSLNYVNNINNPLLPPA